MNKTYLTNVTLTDGSRRDVCLGGGASGCGDSPWPGIKLREPIRCTPAGEMSVPNGARHIDAAGKLLMPALFDLHAKVEIAGCSKRESVMRTGQAAQQGGVWGMLVMPTPGFCFDNSDKLDSFRDMVLHRSAAEMLPAGCISIGMQGEQQAPYNTLMARGVNILSDAGRMPHSLLMLHRAMKYAASTGYIFALAGDVPELTRNTYMHPGTTSYRLGLHGTPSCAEEIGLETIIRLAQDAGTKLHVQTVSTAGGVEIIRRAKAAGCRVTAEVALHHLLFTHEAVGDYDTTFKTLPPLRDRADCEALIAGVKDGTIDCIVSDHTPCIPFAKKQDFITAPQGMVMLDTMLPAIYTHLVKPGLLSWDDVVRACCVNPLRVLARSEEMDDEEEGISRGVPLLLFDPTACSSVTPDTLPCGTLNSPFLGQELCGSVTLPI